MIKLDVVIPKGVQQLLQTLQAALGTEYEVTLAGGFLRDTFGGAPIKDIDIMIAPNRSTKPEVGVLELLERACIPDWFNSDVIFPGDYLGALKSRGVESIVMGNCPNLDNIESQLIIYGKPMSRSEIAHDMDLNICQIIGFPKGDVYATQEFIDGFNTETIEVLQGKDNPDREKEHVERIGKKYPSFTIKE